MLGNIITFLIAALVIGYGLFMLVRSLKKQSKGECCSCDGCDKASDCGSKN